MQPLASYQDAHDSEYERLCARDDAIDREIDAIIASKDDMLALIEQMIERDQIQPAELIALSYASLMSLGPDWFRKSLMQYCLYNLQKNIDDVLLREATETVDRREATAKQELDLAVPKGWVNAREEV